MILELQTLLGLLAVAELSRQVVHESSLAQAVKQVLMVDGNRESLWKNWGSPRNWWKVTGRWFFPLLPVIAVVMVLSNIMLLVTSICDCDRCLGYHFGWLSLYFFFGFAILPSLIYAPLVIVFVYLIEKLKK